MRAELDADLNATTGPLVDRARQAAWVPECRAAHRRGPLEAGRGSSRATLQDEATKAFQRPWSISSRADLGLRAESTAIDWDPDNEELLRVYSPVPSSAFGSTRTAGTTDGPTLNHQTASRPCGNTPAPCRSTPSIGDLAGTLRGRQGVLGPSGNRSAEVRRSLFGGRR